MLVGVLAPAMSVDIPGYDRGYLSASVTAFFVVSGVVSVVLMRRRRLPSASSLAFLSACVAAAGYVVVGLGGGRFFVLVGVGIAGMAQAMGVPAANAILSSTAGPRSQGALFGMRQSAIPLAGMVAGGAAPILAEAFGWKAVMVGIGLSLPPLVLMLLGGYPGNSGGEPAEAVKEESGIGFGSKRLLIIATGGLLAAMVVSGLVGFFVTFAVAEGLTLEDAGRVVFVASLAGLTVRVASGVYADSSKLKSTTLAGILLIIGSLGFVAVSTGFAPLIVLGGILAYCGAWGWPGLFHLSLARMFRGQVSRASTAAQVALSTGGAVGPPIFVAVWAILGSAAWAWGIWAILALMSSSLLFLATREERAHASAI